MLLPEISAAMDVTREKRRRDADRRAQEPRLGEPETAAPVAEWALGPAAAPWLGDLGRLLRAPDLRGEPATPPDAGLADAPAGSIAYDTLTHYLTDDARNL